MLDYFVWGRNAASCAMENIKVLISMVAEETG
jgi:hypothetical protein